MIFQGRSPTSIDSGATRWQPSNLMELHIAFQNSQKRNFNGYTRAVAKLLELTSSGVVEGNAGNGISQ
jgi:hypothetical protein